MQAITVRDRDAGVAGLSLTEMPYPNAGENDVIVRVHSAGFISTELEWTGTWADRAGRDRTPSIVGHDLSGVVAELGPGTTGLTVGQRVFGLTDWFRNGTLAEYTAVEARNLAPLPADVDHVTAAALPISGLTAWQALFDHGHLQTGQSVLIHGAAGGVGSIAVQLARDVGAVVIGTGRAADRDTVLGLGAHAFLDLEADKLEDTGDVDVVFDVIGGEILDRSAALVRAGGTLLTIVEMPAVKPIDGRAIFFVVESDRVRLAELARRLSDGRLKPIVGEVRPLAEAPAAFGPSRRTPGKTIIRVLRRRIVCVPLIRFGVLGRRRLGCLAPQDSVHYHARHGSDQWPAYSATAGGPRPVSPGRHGRRPRLWLRDDQASRRARPFDRR